MHVPIHFAGFGLGLRKPHYAEFVEGRVDVDFIEVISENCMVDGGRPRQVLREVRAHYPVALHGVSMSVESADGIDRDYLRRLRLLIDETRVLHILERRLQWVSLSTRTTFAHGSPVVWRIALLSPAVGWGMTRFVTPSSGMSNECRRVAGRWMPTHVTSLTRCRCSIRTIRKWPN